MAIAETLNRPAKSGRIPEKAARIAQASSAPILAILFLLSVATPLSITIGGVFFTVARLYCFVLFVPIVILWLTGRAGRILTCDLLLVAYMLWTFVCLFMNQGTSQMVYGLSQTVEILGSYLLARVSIRSKEDFHYFAKWFVALVIALLPFAFYEAQTGRQPLREIFSVLPVVRIVDSVDYGTRLGMVRSQVTFEHPILYGVFCSMAFSMAWLSLQAYGVSATGRFFRSLGVFLATFFSLSSGALSVLMLQLMLILWDAVLKSYKARWKMFTGLFASVYVALSILSNRGPIILMITYATFSTGTAWYRVAIWQYGSEEVWRHPIFGKGLFSYWIRPSWMVVGSIDNHWLLMAMRYGFPGIGLLLLMYFWPCFKMGRLDLSKRPDLTQIRKAYIFTAMGLFISLCTVNAWGAVQQFVFFSAGATLWMLAFDQDLSGQTEAEPPAPRRGGTRTRGAPIGNPPGATPRKPGPRYTRFATTSSSDDRS